MSGVVDFFELLNRDLSVNFGGLDRCMSKDGLDVTDVCSVLEHGGSHAVTEQVATAGLANVRFADRLPDDAADLTTRQAVAFAAKINSLLVAVGDQARPNVELVFL